MNWAAEVPMANTDLNKIYHGHSGMLEFTRRLTEFDFKDFTPVITPLSDDRALVKATFFPKNHASGRAAAGAITELHEWTSKDGKIFSVKVAPTAAGEMNSLFMSKEEATGIVGNMMAAWGGGKFSTANPDSKKTFDEFFTKDVCMDATAVMQNTDGTRFSHFVV